MSIDPGLFRQVAASFPSGVTVITSGTDGAYHGMTASAFTSLSLEPPMILVCVDRAAKTLEVMQTTGIFNVSILRADQEDVSRAFASKYVPGEDGLRGMPYTLSKLGVPVIKDSLAHFECRVALQYDGGDHVIFIGAVEDGAVGNDPDPLVYFRGRYRVLAEA